MTYIPTDAEVKQCCLNCIYFKSCKLVARWNVEYGEDGFYPNCTKCGEFMRTVKGEKEGNNAKVKD